MITLILIFVWKNIINYPLHILLIAIPPVLQTYLVFWIGYAGSNYLNISCKEATPFTFIGASSFFELAAAVVLVLFGMNSGVALANAFLWKFLQCPP